MRKWNRLCSLKDSQVTKGHQSWLPYQAQHDMRDGQTTPGCPSLHLSPTTASTMEQTSKAPRERRVVKKGRRHSTSVSVNGNIIFCHPEAIACRYKENQFPASVSGRDLNLWMDVDTIIIKPRFRERGRWPQELFSSMTDWWEAYIDPLQAATAAVSLWLY